jgi:photosystem II stability/assembly factor-like uncharacterized protein
LTELHFSGGNILVTNDGGRNWQMVLSASSEVRKFMFVNDQIGFALTTGSWGGIAEAFKTIDGGQTWIRTELDVALPDSAHFDPYAAQMFFVDEKTGWLAGRCSTLDWSGPATWGTTDGGEHWELQWWKKYSATDMSPFFTSVHFVDKKTGWAVGTLGFIAKCTDGKTWQELKKVTDLPLHTVHFIDEENGFISGGYANYEGFRTVLFKTADGGKTWHEIPEVHDLIHEFYLHGTRRGWAVGTDKDHRGVILETRDGGNSWTVQVDNLIGQLNALSYRDHFLWAAGDYGLVLRTPVDSTTAVDEQPDEMNPSTFELSQNYPNPFSSGARSRGAGNSATTIEFALPQPAFVSLKIFNILGEEIATLVAESLTAGRHHYVWQPKGLASGVYVYRLEAGTFVQTRKLILLR